MVSLLTAELYLYWKLTAPYDFFSRQHHRFSKYLISEQIFSKSLANYKKNLQPIIKDKIANERLMVFE